MAKIQVDLLKEKTIGIVSDATPGYGNLANTIEIIMRLADQGFAGSIKFFYPECIRTKVIDILGLKTCLDRSPKGINGKDIGLANFEKISNIEFISIEYVQENKADLERLNIVLSGGHTDFKPSMFNANYFVTIPPTIIANTKPKIITNNDFHMIEPPVNASSFYNIIPTLLSAEKIRNVLEKDSDQRTLQLVDRLLNGEMAVFAPYINFSEGGMDTNKFANLLIPAISAFQKVETNLPKLILSLYALPDLSGLQKILDGYCPADYECASFSEALQRISGKVKICSLDDFLKQSHQGSTICILAATSMPSAIFKLLTSLSIPLVEGAGSKVLMRSLGLPFLTFDYRVGRVIPVWQHDHESELSEFFRKSIENQMGQKGVERWRGILDRTAALKAGDKISSTFSALHAGLDITPSSKCQFTPQEVSNGWRFVGNTGESISMQYEGPRYVNDVNCRALKAREMAASSDADVSLKLCVATAEGNITAVTNLLGSIKQALTSLPACDTYFIDGNEWPSLKNPKEIAIANNDRKMLEILPQTFPVNPLIYPAYSSYSLFREKNPGKLDLPQVKRLLSMAIRARNPKFIQGLAIEYREQLTCEDFALFLPGSNLETLYAITNIDPKCFSITDDIIRYTEVLNPTLAAALLLKTGITLKKQEMLSCNRAIAAARVISADSHLQRKFYDAYVKNCMIDSNQLVADMECLRNITTKDPYVEIQDCMARPALPLMQCPSAEVKEVKETVWENRLTSALGSFKDGALNRVIEEGVDYLASRMHLTASQKNLAHASARLLLAYYSGGVAGWACNFALRQALNYSSRLSRISFFGYSVKSLIGDSAGIAASMLTDMSLEKFILLSINLSANFSGYSLTAFISEKLRQATGLFADASPAVHPDVGMYSTKVSH